MVVGAVLRVDVRCVVTVEPWRFSVGPSYSVTADLRQIQCENVHLNQRVPLESHHN